MKNALFFALAAGALAKPVEHKKQPPIGVLSSTVAVLTSSSSSAAGISAAVPVTVTLTTTTTTTKTLPSTPKKAPEPLPDFEPMISPEALRTLKREEENPTGCIRCGFEAETVDALKEHAKTHMALRNRSTIFSPKK